MRTARSPGPAGRVVGRELSEHRRPIGGGVSPASPLLPIHNARDDVRRPLAGEAAGEPEFADPAPHRPEDLPVPATGGFPVVGDPGLPLVRGDGLGEPARPGLRGIAYLFVQPGDGLVQALETPQVELRKGGERPQHQGLIAGVGMEVAGTGCGTVADLLPYCRRVAGAVEVLAAGSTRAIDIGEVNGELSLDAGEIHFAGERIDRLPVHRRSQAGLKRAYQVPQFFSSFTTRGNVGLAEDDAEHVRAIGERARPGAVPDTCAVAPFFSATFTSERSSFASNDAISCDVVVSEPPRPYANPTSSLSPSV